MGKTSPSKKRKKDTSKENSSKQSKRAKRAKKPQINDKDGEKGNKNPTVVSHNDGEEEACVLDIDQELDKNASKSSLSVFNVKSIIHVSTS